MKTIKISLAVIFTFFSAATFAQLKDVDHVTMVKEFIENIRTNNKQAIAAHVIYPFGREYPLKRIKTEAEFVTRFDEVFDQNLKNIIIKSNPKKDWTQMGWRGIMLNQGDLWIDEAGDLIGVNYETLKTKNLKKSLIERDKSWLQESLRNFERPVCQIKTKTHIIRIDEMKGGVYRYSSWKNGRKMSEKPDLLIEKGEKIVEGTSRSTHFIFKNEGHEFEINFAIEEEGIDAILTITKDEETLSEQNAVFLNY
ncbi:MAG: hypothetical protein U0V04_05930 [Spirosomataceae bacterium]